MIEWSQLLLRFDKPLPEDIVEAARKNARIDESFPVASSMMAGLGVIKGFSVSHDRRTITYDIDFSDLALPEGHPFA